mgnify:CR=1 FL=1
MKKLKVLGLAAIAAGMFSLTSCLDGGGNTQQLSSYAIVDYSSTMRTLIYPLGYYPLYVATIANDPTYSAGDCVLANFTVDFDSADNANASTNGFYVATGAASSPLAKYDLSYSPLDSMALDNELLCLVPKVHCYFLIIIRESLLFLLYICVDGSEEHIYNVDGF